MLGCFEKSGSEDVSRQAIIQPERQISGLRAGCIMSLPPYFPDRGNAKAEISLSLS